MYFENTYKKYFTHHCSCHIEDMGVLAGCTDLAGLYTVDDEHCVVLCQQADETMCRPYSASRHYGPINICLKFHFHRHFMPRTFLVLISGVCAVEGCAVSTILNVAGSACVQHLLSVGLCSRLDRVVSGRKVKPSD